MNELDEIENYKTNISNKFAEKCERNKQGMCFVNFDYLREIIEEIYLSGKKAGREEDINIIKSWFGKDHPITKEILDKLNTIGIK